MGAHRNKKRHPAGKLQLSQKQTKANAIWEEIMFTLAIKHELEKWEALGLDARCLNPMVKETPEYQSS